MKNKKLKISTSQNDDVKLIRNLIIILVVVVLIAGGFYFLTDKLVEPKKVETPKPEINYEVATVGTMFNRPYDEYLVLLYDSTSVEAAYYNTLFSRYNTSGEDKIYFIDFNLKENSNYVKESSNKNLTSASDAQFAGPTLVRIKNGKVTKYLDTKEEIKKELEIEE